MQTMELTSVSSKGQVVIPASARKALGISSGTKLMVLTDGSNVLLRPLAAPRINVFRSLIRQSRRFAAETNLEPAAVEQAIRKVRRARGR